MKKIDFKDLPSTNTPLSAGTLNTLQDNMENAITDLLDKIFPIGRVIVDETDTDYSNYLGFTWKRTLAGKFPVGLDTSQGEFIEVGKKGGKTAVQLSANIGACNNNGDMIGYIAETHTAYQNNHVANFVLSTTGQHGFENWNHSTPVTESGSESRYVPTVPPYQVVSYWTRVA